MIKIRKQIRKQMTTHNEDIKWWSMPNVNNWSNIQTSNAYSRTLMNKLFLFLVCRFGSASPADLDIFSTFEASSSMYWVKFLVQGGEGSTQISTAPLVARKWVCFDLSNARHFHPNIKYKPSSTQLKIWLQLAMIKFHKLKCASELRNLELQKNETKETPVAAITCSFCLDQQRHLLLSSHLKLNIS